MDRILQIEYVNTEELIPYVNNSRTHSDEQIDQIAASIKEFGFTNPILINDEDTIIAGHGRLRAARKVGLEQVPCLRLIGLTDTQIKALVIADNKLALNAGWDDELLKHELSFLDEADYDLSLLGFDEDELDDLLATAAEDIEEEEELPEPQEDIKSKNGDIWKLGNHRLMCGDSTDMASVLLLLDGNKPDMLFTDPPYNVAFNGRSGNHDVIMNDDLTVEAFKEFIDNFINIVKELKLDTYYIWCNWNFYGVLQGELDYKSCIVWAKNVFGMGNGYRHQHEFCLFNGKIDASIKNESDLWEIKKDTNYVHPTQKPIELSMRALGNHKKAKHILDLFGGSGSTLIGCEHMNRRAYVMELDPQYVDVIIRRWQTMTGEQAIHEDGTLFDER